MARVLTTLLVIPLLGCAEAPAKKSEPVSFVTETEMAPASDNSDNKQDGVGNRAQPRQVDIAQHTGQQQQMQQMQQMQVQMREIKKELKKVKKMAKRVKERRKKRKAERKLKRVLNNVKSKN